MPRLASLRRPLAVFVLAFGLLAVLAGPRLWRPSKDNHFTHLAHGWLQGRLSLPGKPPGYCSAKARAAKKCRGHRYDDWAVVWELELTDGTAVRGYPCRRDDCLQRRRTQRVETWLVTGGGEREIPSREIQSRRERWYVSFPPGPAAVFLPFVALFGLGLWDVLITAVAAAAIPVVLLGLFDRERGTADGRGAQHLWAVAAWTLASPALFLGAHGRVWFTAQVFAALFVCLALHSGWNLRRPGWTGLWLALAVACRPAGTPFLAVVFVAAWWRQGRDLRSALRFVAPLVIIGVAIAVHNYVRFEDPLQFGHRYLDIRWQARMQEVGMFSSQYLPRNLECMLWLMPQLGGPAMLRLSIHGTALWLGSPWLLLAPAASEAFPQRVPLAIAVAGSAVPALLYQNSGQLQTSYRFAVDWLPLVLASIVFGGGVRRRIFGIAVVLGAVFHLWTAWNFDRAPRDLFVLEPMGWPFVGEFE